jgi:hypothetical protein
MVPKIKGRNLKAQANNKKTFIAFKIEFPPQVIENNALLVAEYLTSVQKTTINNAVRANQITPKSVFKLIFKNSKKLFLQKLFSAVIFL